MRTATFVLILLLFLADGRLHAVGAEAGAVSSQVVTMTDPDLAALDESVNADSLRAAVDPSAAARDRFGLQQGGTLQFLSQPDLERHLDGMAALGAGWVRFDIAWSSIQESGPNQYRWEKYDNVIQSANARGLKILGVIAYTPAWARPHGTSDKTPPSNVADYGNFVSAVVSRYSVAPYDVHHWEIWNEPNHHDFWSPRADVAKYTALLKEAYTAAKAVDPSAVIITGGTAPAPSNGTDTDPRSFLRGIYDNGGKGFFDAVGHHPYTFPDLPDRDPTINGGDPNWSSWFIMASSSPSLRSIMVSQGDGNKKIWATEFGFPSSGGSAAVTEDQQAAYTARGLQLFSSYPWAGPLFLYKFHDDCTNPDSYDCGHGLTRVDYTPKPAYRAYRNAASAPTQNPAGRRTRPN